MFKYSLPRAHGEDRQGEAMRHYGALTWGMPDKGKLKRAGPYKCEDPKYHRYP